MSSNDEDEVVLAKEDSESGKLISCDPPLLSTSPEDEVMSNKLLVQLFMKNFDGPSSELRTCRLVSKQWKDLATNKLREYNWTNRNFIVLNGAEQLMKYALCLMPSLNGNLYEGRRALAKGKLVAHEELIYESYDCKLKFKTIDELTVDAEISETFFQLIPDCVKSLKLVTSEDLIIQTSFLTKILKSQSSSLTELRVSAKEIETNLVRQLERKNVERNADEGVELNNLKYLCLKMSIGNTWRIDERDKFLNYFLKKIPKNKVLKICLDGWDYVNQTIESLRKYGQIQNLKFFSNDMSFLLSELKWLGEAGVRLETLVANYSSNNSWTKNVYDFLCTQVDNLEKLSWDTSWRFQFPVQPMAELKTLQLISTKYAYSDEDDEETEWNGNCRPIFYGSFPKLENLEFMLEREWTIPIELFLDWYLPPQPPSTQLKTFAITYELTNSQVIVSISQTFPRLTSLKLGRYTLKTHGEEISFYKTLWGADFGSTLENFSIALCSYSSEEAGEHPIQHHDDSLFSGVNEEMIAMANASSNYDTSLCQAQGPSIRNYKNLRTLEIHSKEGWPYRFFTDFSAHTVFGELSSLSALYLPPNLCKFTKEASVQLQEKLRKLPKVQYHYSSDERLEKAFKTSVGNRGESYGWKDFRDLDLDSLNEMPLESPEQSSDSSSSSDSE